MVSFEWKLWAFEVSLRAALNSRPRWLSDEKKTGEKIVKRVTFRPRIKCDGRKNGEAREN